MMAKRRAFFCSLLCLGLAMGASACSDDSSDKTTGGEEQNGDGQNGDGQNGDGQNGDGQNGDEQSKDFIWKVATERPDRTVSPLINSQSGCALDDDCAKGLFCFHSSCTKECDEKTPCKSGLTCSARGRCVVAASTAPGASLDSERKAEIERDFEEAKAAASFDVLPGVEIVDNPAAKVEVPMAKVGSTNPDPVKVTIATSKDVGDVQYILLREGNLDAAKLKLSAKKTVDEATKIATYTFEITPAKAHLGEELGGNEIVYIDSNVGFFQVTMTPRPKASGLYSGTVTAPQFGGVSMRLQMGVEVTPANPGSIDEVTQIVLHMPVSDSEVFSPSSPDEKGEIRWESVVMKQETIAANCSNGKKCWYASFSSNDFVMPGSRVLTADQKINRSMRIEFTEFDASRSRFVGTLRDMWAGVYRYTDGSNKNWATPTLNGELVVVRSDVFDTSKIKTAAHQLATKPDYDKITLPSASDKACGEDAFKALMAFAKEKTECANVKLAEINNTEENKACLSAAVKGILSDENLVSKIIPNLVDGKEGSNTKYANLKDFMEDCEKSDGICKQRPEIVCAIELLSQKMLADESTSADDMKNWIELMRESYLGRQYAAWTADTDMRLAWLENSTAPMFMASALEKLNTEKLQAWEKSVLDTHADIVGRQFSRSTLELLNRVTNSDEVKSTRNKILADMSQAWESVSDALITAAERYNVLYEDDSKRTSTSKRLNRYLFDLYYVGLVESEMNNRADKTSLNASFGKNVASIVDNIYNLSLKFDDLVYLRDAKIVVSASLSNTSTSRPSVLDERKKLAKDTIKVAADTFTKVTEDYSKKNISKASIQSTLQNHLESLKSEITGLCGLPSDCELAAFSSKQCTPLTLPFQCGFQLASDLNKLGNLNKVRYSASTLSDLVNDMCPGDPDKVAAGECGCGYIEEKEKDKNGNYILKRDKNGQIICSRNENANFTALDVYDAESKIAAGSTAGSAISAYREAYINYEIARAEYEALVQKVNNTQTFVNKYSDAIEAWNNKRMKLITDVMNNVNIINKHLDNVTEAERNSLLASSQQLEQAYKKQHKNFEDWDDRTAANLGIKIGTKVVTTQLSSYALFLDATSEYMSSMGDAMAENTKAGAAFTANAVGGAAKLSAYNASFSFALVSAGVQSASAEAQMVADIADMSLSYQNDYHDKKLEDEIKKLEKDFQSALTRYEVMGSESECNSAISAVEDKVLKEHLHCYEQKVCDCKESDGFSIYHGDNCPTDKCTLTTQWYLLGDDQWALMEQNAADTIDQINDYMRELFETTDQYERDQLNYDEKLKDCVNMQQDLRAKALQVSRAALVVQQAANTYISVSERAGRLMEQYNAANERFKDLSNLYDTPASIFAFASNLNVVENKLELARDRIYDYLAAVEYLAVRPFVDLRRATYLARSTNDLDAIVDQVDSIVSKCGGAVSNNKVELSVRELMGITTEYEGMSSAERFRYMLKKRIIPVDTLARYTVMENVGDLLGKNSDLRAATFQITPSSNVNIAATCNTKIDSISIQLVGENLVKDGVSKATPTVTLFYNGQSQLISCQPNIKDLVQTLNGRSAYGPYSTFYISDTKISPTAGFNEFNGDANNTLKEYPLVSSYTVLIDPTLNDENKKINWDNVEDIKIMFEYNYQDLFSKTSECVKL